MHSRFKYFPLLALVVFISCKGKVSTQAATPPPVYVSVTTVKDTIAGGYDEYPASLTALNEVRLTAQVSGYITGVYFKDGD